VAGTPGPGAKVLLTEPTAAADVEKGQ
jgi:hypothetical protein